MLTTRHPAAKQTPLASALLLALTLCLLSACETTGFGNLGESGETRAQRLAESGRYAESAKEYIYLASNSEGGERDRLTLLAVEQWLDDGDTRRAENAFNKVAQPADGPALPIWNSNAAAMALFRGEADAALSILEPLSREALPTSRRLRIDALRADAWIQKQDPTRAIELMTYRESWLDSRSQIANGRARLWQGLLVSNPVVLRESAKDTSDPQVRGWLSLGALATSTGQQGIGWNRGLSRWLNDHRNHPAISVLDDIRILESDDGDIPQQVALLLPLSGRFQSTGEAVQNGFMGAYFSTIDALGGAQTIRVYDVIAEGGAGAAYQTAVADGADFVVGPLFKNDVLEVANDSLVPVPVLTLNYLPDETLPPPGLYQFALAPEDEAASAADRAINDGYTRAVALVPNNDWGRRLLRSFATEFEGLGGTVLDYRSYTPTERDFSNDIENLMGLSGSVQRYQRLRANLGHALQFDPRRRQDAEFVFLATAAAPGRLLKSQLKFHYSGDLPVYATSSVNAMDGRSNTDLNGIMFADVPWLVDPKPWFSALPESFADYWPEQQRLGRLHAMGFDAYNLIAPLYSADSNLTVDIDGASGNLFMDQNGRIHRRLAWAQFQDGTVVTLPSRDRVGDPIQDMSGDADLVVPNAADEAPWDEPRPER